MGADGGSIPRREELVKEKKKPEKADPNELNKIKWTSCALSKQVLTPPIVTCELGFLYNKTAVLQNLIEKTIPYGFEHIRNIHDIFTVNLKPNPAFNPLEEQNSNVISNLSSESPFVCPITGLEVGGNYKFSFIKSCGCALSDRALKECKSDFCLNCNKPMKKEDIVPLNPSDEERIEIVKVLKEKRAAEKEQKKLKGENGEKKKDKKRKKEKAPKDKENSAPAPKKAAYGPTKNLGDSSVYASLFTSSKKESTATKGSDFTSTKSFS